jgi:hypothetical protein
MANALTLFEAIAGNAYSQKFRKSNGKQSKDLTSLGRKMIMEDDRKLNDLVFRAEGMENSHRTVRITKMMEAYRVFRELINYYAVEQLLAFMERAKIKTIADLQKKIASIKPPAEWLNVGGQLIKTTSIHKLINDITRGKCKGWNEVHKFYVSEGERYVDDKLAHALGVYQQVFRESGKLKEDVLTNMFSDAMATRQWMVEGIRKSREKDYENPFRQMVYENKEEMIKVIGPINENTFILQENEKFQHFKKKVNGLLKKTVVKS